MQELEKTNEQEPVQRKSQFTPQVFVAREYEVFGRLDVDHHSIAATFIDHNRLMESLRLPYGAPQLPSYVRKHFGGQRLAFAYEDGRRGLGSTMRLVAATRVHDLLDGGLSIIRTLAGMRCNGWRRTHRLCISEFNERRCPIEIMHFGN